jgi:hypothetical protein
MMIFRALVMVLSLSGLAVADIDPASAQETKAGRHAGGQTPAVPPTFDPIAARIKYLHDRLRITLDQEPLWDTVARVIRDNAQDTTPLLRERLRAKTSGNALDVLHSYEALGEGQLDSLRKIIAAFDPLYAALSEGQTKIADAILREGPLSTMIGGIPEVPAPFGSLLVYPPGLGVPLFIRRSGGFHHGFRR